MITYSRTWSLDGQDVGELVTLPWPKETALNILVYLDVEIDHLVEVVEMTPTRLEIRSEHDADLKTSVFEGSVEEMRPVIEFAALSLLVGLLDGIDRDAVERYTRMLAGNPLVQTLGAYGILEYQQTNVLLLVACRVSMEDLERGMQLEMGDLVPALELANELGMSLSEALRMAAPSEPTDSNNLPA